MWSRGGGWGWATPTALVAWEERERVRGGGEDGGTGGHVAHTPFHRSRALPPPVHHAHVALGGAFTPLLSLAARGPRRRAASPSTRAANTNCFSPALKMSHSAPAPAPRARCAANQAIFEALEQSARTAPARTAMPLRRALTSLMRYPLPLVDHRTLDEARAALLDGFESREVMSVARLAVAGADEAGVEEAGLLDLLEELRGEEEGEGEGSGQEGPRTTTGPVPAPARATTPPSASIVLDLLDDEDDGDGGGGGAAAAASAGDDEEEEEEEEDAAAAATAAPARFSLPHKGGGAAKAAAADEDDEEEVIDLDDDDDDDAAAAAAPAASSAPSSARKGTPSSGARPSPRKDGDDDDGSDSSSSFEIEYEDGVLAASSSSSSALPPAPPPTFDAFLSSAIDLTDRENDDDGGGLGRGGGAALLPLKDRLAALARKAPAPAPAHSASAAAAASAAGPSKVARSRQATLVPGRSASLAFAPPAAAATGADDAVDGAAAAGRKRKKAPADAGAGAAPPAGPIAADADSFTCPDCTRRFAWSSGGACWTVAEGGVLPAPAAAAAPSPPSSSSSSSSVPPPPLRPHQCRLDVSNWEVVLLIDNREVRTRDDRTYIQAKLLNARVACETRSLPLGDFLWVVRRLPGRKPAPVPAHLRPAGAAAGTAAPPAKKKGGAKALVRANSAPDGASAASGDAAALPRAPAALPTPEDEYLLDVIVERKSCNDLAASLIDGRYMEQKNRLASAGLRVMYLVEGDATKMAGGGEGGGGGGGGGSYGGSNRPAIGPKHLFGAMISTQVMQGFRVVNTFSLDGSVTFIAGMHRAMEHAFRGAGCACTAAAAAAAAGAASAAAAGAPSGGPACPIARAAAAIPTPRPQFDVDMDAVSGIRGGAGTSAGPAGRPASYSPLSPTASSSSSLLATSPASALPVARLCPNDRCALWGRDSLPRIVRPYPEWALLARKPKQLTALNLMGMALRQVQGCGADRAQAILERYPTLASLREAYASLPDPARDGPALLQGLHVPNQRAALGPALSRAIWAVVWGEEGARGAGAAATKGKGKAAAAGKGGGKGAAAGGSGAAYDAWDGYE
jgi:ERCC4-type nuclease